MNEKLTVIWEKVKGIKNFKLIICILIIAIIVLIYIGATSGRRTKNTLLSQVTETKNNTTKYSETEEKLADILQQIEGIEKAKVLISYDSQKKISGVIVVAAGADNPVAEWKIRHAVQTAMKIDYHSIEVFSMK